MRSLDARQSAEATKQAVHPRERRCWPWGCTTRRAPTAVSAWAFEQQPLDLGGRHALGQSAVVVVVGFVVSVGAVASVRCVRRIGVVNQPARCRRLLGCGVGAEAVKDAADRAGARCHGGLLTAASSSSARTRA
eukprot:4991772-Prymnesium_polylepis.1